MNKFYSNKIINMKMNFSKSHFLMEKVEYSLEKLSANNIWVKISGEVKDNVCLQIRSCCLSEIKKKRIVD